MTYDDAQNGWNDEPSADPQIQKDYEAALGEFLVAFNRIENTVSDIIVLALKKAGREEILGSMAWDTFDRKIRNLELISLRFQEIASLRLIAELRALGTERNQLAHGHFEQNPVDGSYVVVNRKNSRLKPVEEIRVFTERTKKADHQLRFFVARDCFEDTALNARALL